MAQTIKLKRSATPSAIPSTASLSLGEVAINTYDGKMFIKKDDGTEAIVEIGSGGGGVSSFADNAKLTFGDSADLEIFHDGSASFITDTGTGNLRIQGTNLALQNAAGTKNYLLGIDAGATTVYYDNAAKLATTSTGIDVTGTATMDGLTVDGNSRINGDFTIDTAPRGFSFASSLEMGSGGSLAVFGNANTSLMSNVYFASDSTYKVINTGLSAAAHQLYNGSHIFSTASAAGTAGSSIDLFTRMNIAKTGDISFYEDTGTTAKLTWDASAESLNFADNGKAIFGAGSDLQIYHDGSNSYIKEGGTGNLRIQADDLYVFNVAGNSVMISALDTGKVGLGYAGAEKLATTSTGIDVTGNYVNSGNLLHNNNSGLKIIGGGDATNAGSNLTLYGGSNASAGTFRFRNGTATHLEVAGNGDISFYEDTGTTPKFFWDASAESLGIGTSTVNADLHLGAASPHIDIGPSAGNRGKVGFDSNNVYIGSTSGTGEIHFKNNIGSTDAPHSSGDTKMVITDSGVGIGTSSPSTSKLHLQGSTGVASAVRVESTGVDSDAYYIADNDASVWTWGIDGGLSDAWILSNAFGLGTPKMTVTTGGNVGIGTATPIGALDVSGTTNAHTTVAMGPSTAATDKEIYLDLYRSNSSNVRQKVGVLRSGIPIAGIRGAELWSYQALGLETAPNASGHIVFKPQGTERMRIDASGNLLVGKTSDNFTIEGFSVRQNASAASANVTMTRDSDHALAVNRLTNDGDLVKFYKDSTAVGSIGARGGDVYLETGDTGIRMYDQSDAIIPVGSAGVSRDAAIDLGLAPNLRFKDLYLSGNSYANTYRHDGDSDTYFNFPADNQLSLVGGGATILKAYQIAGAYGVLEVHGSGSATYPNFTFNGDSNTGMYRAGTDALGFTTAGAERMRIDSSGNLLVGVTSTTLTGGSITLPNSGIIAFHDAGGNARNTLQFVSGELKHGAAGAGLTSQTFFTSASERMRINSSGNVNIGRGADHTDSTARLSVFNSGASESYTIRPGTNVSNQIDILSYNYGTATYLPVRDIASSWIWFSGNAGERARIDTSGNFLVGTDSSSSATAGIKLSPTGTASFVRSGVQPLYVNRLTSDGDLAVFAKDGTTVGSIGTNSGYMVIGSPVGTDAHLLIGNGLIHPATSTGSAKDNAIDIGGTSTRFKDLYLSGIVTASGGTSTNWNTAYGWGDHSTQSYATQSYVGTAISNLVDSAPGTLDTLNELAAALGDDPNFATTVTNSIATKLPLAGGTLTGALTGTTATFNTSVNIDGVILQDSTNRTGLLQVSSATGVWDGFSLAPSGTSHWSIMGDQDDFGLYDDVNDDWIFFYNENGSANIYHDGSVKLTTSSTGVTISGTATATTFSGPLSGNATTATNITGYSGTYWTSNNDGAGSGLDADLLDGQQGSYYYPASNPNGYTTNVGDITGVTAGVGLSGGGTSGTVTLTLDMSELTDMTAAMVGTDEFIVLDASADRRKAANEIGLSIFNNDAGFTTNVGDITGVTAGSFLTGGGTSGTVTLNVDATSANTASKVVARDASGNFSAGTITAALTGNATTATTLQTARTINGVSFNGSANITVADATKLPLTGGTLTGTLTANSGIALANTNITGVNALSFNDPGPAEGITWSGGNIQIYESPDDLTTNTAGNLQVIYGSTRRLTVNSTGIDVNGALTATSKSFVIDHPTKPDMKLRYGSLEGPENGVYVRGRLKDNNVIELPDYWTGLVDEDTITVNLTAIGRGQDLWVEDIADNKVIVGGENVNCFYTVFAERKDVERFEVEYK